MKKTWIKPGVLTLCTFFCLWSFADQNPVPPEPSLPPNDDTLFYITPAPDYGVRAGYFGMGDNRGYDSGGGVGVFLFLDAGRLGLMAQAEVSGAEKSYFGHFKGDLRFRYRIPIDPRHIIWFAAGADISGRYSANPHQDSFFSVQLPMVGIGVMEAKAGQCHIYVFAKAFLGGIETRSQARKLWRLDTVMRPGFGSDVLAVCESFQIFSDFEHIFSFGEAGETDRLMVQGSYLFRPSLKDGETFRIGPFFRGEFVSENGTAGFDPNDPQIERRNIGGLFTGVEIRF